MSGTNVDSEGWSFNSDFGHFVDCSSGSGKKGMIHFVRRRRRIRSQYFDGNVVKLNFKHLSINITHFLVS
jgi:hypothetical protein